MTIIVDGNKIAFQILKRVARQLKILKKKKIIPKLGVILVGKNKASEIYVRKKALACQQVGVDFILKKYPTKITTDKLIEEIKKIQKEKLSGLVVQLPLPKQINSHKVLQQINPEIDVDYLTEKNLGKLISGNYQMEPPSAGSILEILKYYKVKLAGKKIVLVGSGPLIGRPLFNLLLLKEATLIVCNKKTKNLAEMVKQADVLITGVGKRNLIRGWMLKRGVKIIDAGISFYKRRVYGDVNFNEAFKKASLITPVPGGVGPITVAKLIENVVKNAQRLSKRKIKI